MGKTSLFRRIKEDVFDPETVQATAAGIDTCKYETQVGNDKIIVSDQTLNAIVSYLESLSTSLIKSDLSTAW